MRQKCFVFLGLAIFGGLSAYGQKSKINIKSLDSNINLAPLKSKFVNIQNYKKPTMYKSSLPSPEKLDSLFLKVGLSREVASLDQMEKDLLYRKAKRYDLKRLKKSYKSIDSHKLIELQKKVRR